MSGPADRIDAHCHFWRRDRGDYGWLDASKPALAPILRDFAPGDMQPANAAAGIGSLVVVQAAPTEAETAWLLDLAARDHMVAGVVGWVDLSEERAAESLERFAADAQFLGVRPMLQDIADPHWISHAPDPSAMAALERLGLTFDALVTPIHLEPLLAFVRHHDGLPVIVDHAAKPAFGAPAHDPRHQLWEDGMALLAAHDNVWCKLSGLLTELPAERRQRPEEAAEALRLHVERLLEWFGPSRLVWGSDWPVLTLATDHAFWMETTSLLLAPLSEDERNGILGDNARRFYRLDARRQPA